MRLHVLHPHAANRVVDHAPSDMATAVPPPHRPRLVFFYSPISGPSRRVDGFLAQVLQRRHNHATFKLYRVDEHERPDLVKRFGIEGTPALVVVENNHVCGRLVQPRGCQVIESFLGPWLR